MYLWKNGEIIPLDDLRAKISSKTHPIHYATCVIEGTAAYKTKDGIIIFRLDDHLKRLIKGAKTLGLDVPFNFEELKEATLKIVQLTAEKSENTYLRHFCYNSSTELGVGSYSETKVEIVTHPLTPYLGPEAQERGAILWYPAPSNPELQPRRLDSRLCRIKWSGNYGGPFKYKKEAPRYGCQEIVVEGPNGWISETSGSCLLLINEKNELVTPAPDTLPLPGLTLQTVKFLAEKIGYQVKEVHLKYEDLESIIGIALCGTWSEMTQVTGIKVGIPPEEKIFPFSGKKHPLLVELETVYKKMVRGEIPECALREWFTKILV